MRAQTMALYDQLQVTTVLEEQYSIKDGTLGNATRHGAWGRRKGTDSNMLKPT